MMNLLNDLEVLVGEVGVELKVITRVWLLNAKLARNRSRTRENMIVEEVGDREDFNELGKEDGQVKDAK